MEQSNGWGLRRLVTCVPATSFVWVVKISRILPGGGGGVGGGLERCSVTHGTDVLSRSQQSAVPVFLIQRLP